MSRRGNTAVIAKRTATPPADTGEIRALVESAGYDVRGECTQTRRPDSTYELGEGKVETLASLVADAEADAVVFDNDLGPYQAYNLQDAVGTEVVDRKRLVLDIFAERAETRRARLEVRLAELQYDLPRAEEYAKRGEDAGRAGFRSQGETPASQIRADYKRRIREVREQLETVETAADERRRQRRESGRALVALAGYTNAGKSTLLRRLAADLSVDENADRHDDLDATAESRDQLFTTLGTTTRRGTVDGRRALLTDTVGFIGDLPHWMVSSFESTLAESYDADAVVLVVDASDDVETVEHRTRTSLEVLDRYRDGAVVPVLNKRDVVDDLTAKRDTVAAVAAEFECAVDAVPPAMSALEGTNVDTVEEHVGSALPQRETRTFVLPNTDDAMGFVSWCYDHADVTDVSYGGEGSITMRGRPPVLERAAGRAESVASADLGG